jgi:hypothetical protein
MTPSPALLPLKLKLSFASSHSPSRAQSLGLLAAWDKTPKDLRAAGFRGPEDEATGHPLPRFHPQSLSCVTKLPSPLPSFFSEPGSPCRLGQNLQRSPCCRVPWGRGRISHPPFPPLPLDSLSLVTPLLPLARRVWGCSPLGTSCGRLAFVGQRTRPYHTPPALLPL